mmetsp:Transcript_72499/g.216291  ORF Transcript_72499/g.216291 Transcript_72499/m.216291 type:complete len:497 (+) Transcript_72499:910-2400(+)
MVCGVVAPGLAEVALPADHLSAVGVRVALARALQLGADPGDDLLAGTVLDGDRADGVRDLEVPRPPREPHPLGDPRGEDLQHLVGQRPAEHPQLRRPPLRRDGRGAVGPEDVGPAGLRALPAGAGGRVVVEPRLVRPHTHVAGLVREPVQDAHLRAKLRAEELVLEDHRSGTGLLRGRGSVLGHRPTCMLQAVGAEPQRRQLCVEQQRVLCAAGWSAVAGHGGQGGHDLRGQLLAGGHLHEPCPGLQRHLKQLRARLRQTVPENELHGLGRLAERLRRRADGRVPPPAELRVALAPRQPRKRPLERRLRRRAPGREALRVVKGHVLLLRARDGVVVLQDPHGLHERLQVRVAPAGERHRLLGHLQEGAGLPHEALQRWPGGGVPGPEHVRAVGVREEVVCLQRPRHALLLRLCGDVGCRRGVERAHAAVQIGVVDDLVEVNKPVLRGLVLEVRPHREHDMLPAGDVRQLLRRCHEVVHPGLHVVVVDPHVVLDRLV